MLDKFKNPIIFACSCSTVLVAILACVLGSNVGGSNSLQPVRSLKVTIAEGQREELFAQFQKFAKDNGFKIEITDYGNRGIHFQIWMVRDNIQIVSEDVPGNSSKYDVDFYGLYPGSPVDEEAPDEVLTELKSYIAEIPDLTITEEK